MASTDRHLQGMEDIITCSICQELYTDARELKCKHCFCLACLRDFQTTVVNKPCPMCREDTVPPARELHRLPANQAVNDMVNAVTQSDAAGMQRSISEVSALQDGVALGLAQIGTDMNVLDSQQVVLEETTLRLRGTLSLVEDLDYAEAITQMNKEMLALEAAQSSFAKISQLNLFDYIK